jgi:hypothetical protein
MSIKDSDLIAVTDEIYLITSKLIAEGSPPFAVAAALTMIGMQIYKTSLSKEDYYKMVDSISNSRDQVLSFDNLDFVSHSGSFH